VRLTLDLRLEPREQAEPGERLVSIGELAAMMRAPRELAALLWGSRWEAVDVVTDPVLPLSGVQAGALGLAALARARRFGGGGRPPFLARAVAAFVVAMPAELWRTRRLLRQAKSAATRDYALPLRAGAARSVVYLRTEPTLRWRGQLVGGASTHTSGVINGFAANEVDIEVFAAERPEWTDEVRVTEVPLRRLLHLVFWLTLTDYGNVIVGAAEGRRPDFVYQRYSMGTDAGLELAARLGVPLVLEYNGSELWIQKHWGSGPQVQRLDTLAALEEENVRQASLIVVVSEVLKEQLVAEGVDPARVLVNPNGVDVDRVARFRERPAAEWREDAGLEDAPTVGFVGSFGMWHGVKVLPAMIDHVAQAVPEARWVLIGDGPLFAEVRDEIESRGVADRVRMTGVVAHDDALALLAACDVCVSPHVTNPDGTRFFGSPTKLFEYMGLAKPIVASDLEQIGEVIEHERTGILCPPGDAEAAAAAVVRLLGDETLRTRLGEAALERAATDYSWQAHCRRILDALT
jgi:glycosyltransferase involved in cell wall biosynthesis